MTITTPIERLALEKREAEERLRTATLARRVMAECSRVQARASEEGQMLRDMCRIVVQTGGYRLAWIGLAQNDENKTIRPVASAGDDAEFLLTAGISWGEGESGQGPAGVAIRSRKPQSARHLDADPHFSKWRADTVARGYRSVAALPLVAGEEAIGVLGILSGEPEAFDAEELAFLDGLAHDIGYGLSNLRLRAKQIRAEQLLRLEHAVTRCLAEANTAAAALQAAIRAVCETESWDCGRYFRVDEAAGVLRFEEAWGIPSAGIQTFIERSRSLTYAAGAALVGRVWQSGEPLWIADLNRDPRPARAAYTPGSGIRSAFLFPATSGGKTLGVFNFSSREIREPDERLLQAVRVIGSQVGQFLRRMQGQEELQRFRAAMDLSRDSISLVDRATMRFIDVNRTACQQTGFTREEFLQMGPHDLGEMTREQHARFYDDLIAGGQAPATSVSTRRHKDGTVVPVEIHRSVVPTESGHIIVAVVRNISERLRAEQLQNLEHSIARCLAEADTAPAALKFAMRAICESEHWECGRYFAVDEAADVLRMSDAWHGPDAALEQFVAKSRAAAIKRGAGMAGLAWQSGQPQWSTDINNDPRALRPAFTGNLGMKGLFVFPVASENRTIGVLAFSSREARDPDDGLLQAVSAIGSQVGQFLQRKLAETDSRLAARRQAMEHAVTRALAESSTIDAAMPQLIRIICETLGWACGNHWKWDETTELLRCVESWHIDAEGVAEFAAASRDNTNEAPAWRGGSPPGTRTGGVVRGVWFSGAPVWVPDVAQQQGFRRGLVAAKAGLHCAFGFPILAAERPLGVMEFYGRDIKEPDEALLRMVRAIGSQIGQFVQRKSAEEALRESEARFRNQALQQRLIAEFGQQALASAELAEVLASAAKLIAETLNADFSNVFELAPDRSHLIYRAAIGWPPEWVGKRTVAVQAGSRLERILTRREPLVFENYGKETGYSVSPLLEFGVRSGVQVPIFGPAALYGVLGVHTLQVRRFTDDDVSFLRSVANILAIAVERKNAEDKVAHLAQFDTVTGLPNRNLFRDRLGQTLTQAQRNGWQGGMLFVDLDRFKAVNDTYGHGVGDKLLREVASRIKASVRAGDTVARLSGDEFAVVLSRLAKADDAGLVSQKVIDALAGVFELDGHQVYVSASIGIAVYPSDGNDADVLVKNADTAMYRAKEQGRSCYRFYLPQMNERLMERMRTESRLRGALERGEYRLHYQPKVRLDTGVISGFEALLRWEHGGKLVPPLEFISILEDTGLIVAVGEWVLRTACDQIGKWTEMGIPPRPVAVNLSARQFQQKDLVKMVRQILQETRVAADLLELELTETLLMSDAEEAVQMLRELKELGVRLSVDDFGTGYSSLAYLRRFTLDTLKIDRTFIRDVTSKPDDATLTLTIINLAHSMGLKVVAEGVETEGQLGFLRLHGCDEIQGYYFARPMDRDDCTQALVEDRRLQQPEARSTDGLPALLLVDDNENDLQLMTRALATDDFTTLTATGAAAGFEMLARHGAQVVIADHRMPGMSGVEFLANVRKLYPKTVRILVTGSDDPPTLTRAVNNAGIHHFLSKSWEPARLRAEVREAFLQSLRVE